MPASDPPGDDRWGPLAAAYRWQEPLQHRSVDAMLAVLAPRPDEVLLDVGAGVGLVARRLRTGPHRLVVSEPSAGMVAAADYRAAGAVRGDVTNLPVAAGSVDVVTASWLLHVLDDDARRRAVGEVARVLRPGGRFGLVVPAVPRTALQQLVRDTARTLAGLRDLRAFTVPVDLPGLLTDAGLQVRHHARTGRGYLADVVVCTRAGATAGAHG